ncbi:MAG: hypothetical protein AB1664_09970, partial [Thermodesulfobacteriota bacterium]
TPIPVVKILGFSESPRLKKTGRGRRPPDRVRGRLCRPELVDIVKKNVPKPKRQSDIIFDTRYK